MSGIAQRLQEIQARVEAATRAAGRDPDSVTLIAVSKMHPAESIREAYVAGHRDFGENYAQELAAKREQLADLHDIRWHFIGALQSNKAKVVVPGTVLVHAVDRPSVAEALAKRARGAGVLCDALIEVNVGGEASKAGVDPGSVAELLQQVSMFEGLRIHGLMTIPPPAETPEAARPSFRRLREMRDRLRGQFPTLEYLSMGMSGDFETAIGEGATHVRVGTAIFGSRS